MSVGSRSTAREAGSDRGSPRVGRATPPPGPVASLRDAIPVLAVLSLVAIELIAPRTPEYTYVRVALVVTVLLASARYLLLWHRARQTAAAHWVIETRLATETGDRDATLRSMTRLEAGTTMAETAQRICAEALTLPGIDAAWLSVVADDGIPRVLATAGILPGVLIGRAATPGPGAQPIEVGTVTVWFERPEPGVSGHLADLAASAVKGVLVAPFRWEERLAGFVGIGTRAADVSDGLVHRAATARELAVVAAALLGPTIGAEERARRTRDAFDDLIAGEAWWPVFQPIAEIATGRVVGYEALTRFADNRAPDEAFAQSRLAGRGLELECASIARAITESSVLDPDTYLSLNVSPDLALRPDLLGVALRRPGRQLVLEITEQIPIDNYEKLVATLYALDAPIRIAVDDAGAGYAGLQQILALRPNLVKLDSSLTRSVDTDLARQALIGAMGGFATWIETTLVAEGVETQAEADMLGSLGVKLMQGYLVGRPALAATFASNPTGRAAASGLEAGSDALSDPGLEDADALPPPLALPASVTPTAPPA